MTDNAFPQVFLARMQQQLGDDYAAFLSSYDMPAYRGIRFRGQVPAILRTDLDDSIPYARNAYYLHTDSKAGGDILHEAGAFYIQEPSAMTAAAVLAPEDQDIVLDLCAAPGGKSTQLAMSATLRLLIANEPILSRAQILSRNIERMGIANAIVTSAYPDALAARWPAFFDKILVDAPCSGEGMFRKHPEARTEWTADSPLLCAQRQSTILDSAAVMLKPGGRMVYSTCTFNHIENEDTIAAFLDKHADFSLVPFSLPGLPPAPGGMLHLWPHQIKGEGHFVALLVKSNAKQADKADVLHLPPLKDQALLSAWSDLAALLGCTDIQPNFLFANKLCALPAIVPPIDKIKVLRAGLQLGELRGKIFIPDHALALSHPLERTITVDESQAAAYLHGDTLPCDQSLRGFYVLEYCGYQLGFVKASDDMLKNHYPKGLRK